jgi:hypothetical protein
MTQFSGTENYKNNEVQLASEAFKSNTGRVLSTVLK